MFLLLKKKYYFIEETFTYLGHFTLDFLEQL